jgi:uncharacterized protein with FMN-binding domain
MRRTFTALVGAIALAAPVGTAVGAVRATAVATAPKKKVVTVTKSVTGPQGQADRWGDVEVTLVVKKTTTTVGTKHTVTRRITTIRVPMYPDHTDRSVYISQQALPYLAQEALQAQFNPNIQLVSGATYTSQGFVESLQGALALARKI